MNPGFRNLVFDSNLKKEKFFQNIGAKKLWVL